MKIRKIFTLRQPIGVYCAGGSGVRGKLMIPKGLAIPVDCINIDFDLDFVVVNQGGK